MQPGLDGEHTAGGAGIMTAPQFADLSFHWFYVDEGMFGHHYLFIGGLLPK